jgi:4-diphosphocytidyl-2-C-methyl-D-erythritol kinase
VPRIRLAPAKINLALHVTGRRDDGYHLLDSLVVFARLGDRVSVQRAETDSFAVTGPFAADVPEDVDNLVLRARDRLRTAAGDGAFPVAIRLDKNLPVASGLGGGSSDAAAALRELAGLWHVPAAALAAVAARLGADVPMCVKARPLLAKGIGQDIAPARIPFQLPMVLVNPGMPVSTPAVFAALQNRENKEMPALPALSSAASLVGWLRITRNDLEAPAQAIAPEIGAALAALTARGARLARMSGSGATCFGIFGDAEAATRAADRIRRDRPGWFVAATETMASGDVPHGAH